MMPTRSREDWLSGRSECDNVGLSYRVVGRERSRRAYRPPRWSRNDAADGRCPRLIPSGLPPLGKAEICEGTGHKNAQPTHPERNAQAADLCLPSKDDSQEMDYCHDEKQRGGDRHIGFSVQAACPFTSRAQHDDSSTTTSCSMPRSFLACRFAVVPGLSVAAAFSATLSVGTNGYGSDGRY
jgi:hypothetical protein